MSARTKSRAKFRPAGAAVGTFLAKVTPPTRRQDALAVAALMEKLSGEKPVMWGPSIVGFGSCHYRYESGREGDMPLVAFAPRKTALVLYINACFPRRDALLAKLGPVKTGVACIYVKNLADLNRNVLAAMIKQSLAYLRKTYPRN